MNREEDQPPCVAEVTDAQDDSSPVPCGDTDQPAAQKTDDIRPELQMGLPQGLVSDDLQPTMRAAPTRKGRKSRFDDDDGDDKTKLDGKIEAVLKGDKPKV